MRSNSTCGNPVTARLLCVWLFFYCEGFSIRNLRPGNKVSKLMDMIDMKYYCGPGIFRNVDRAGAIEMYVVGVEKSSIQWKHARE